jgi:hypothetical protein
MAKSTVQGILHLSPIQTLVRDLQQRDAVVACHASDADTT